MQHALKIEDLNLSHTEADDITQILGDFLEHGLGFRPERVEELECRSRDGFMAYSHNKGGVEAIGFIGQISATSFLSYKFKNAHKTLDKYYQYDLESFLESKGLPKGTQLTDELDQEFYEHRCNDEEATVLLSADLMLTSSNSLNIRLCVCVKDAPYHRSYDDLISLDVEFSSVYELVNQLEEILKNNELVRDFAQAASETY